MGNARKTGIENIIRTLKRVRNAAETVMLSGDDKRILKYSRKIIGVYAKNAADGKRLYDERYYIGMISLIEETAEALNKLTVNLNRLGYAKYLSDFERCVHNIDGEISRLSLAGNKSDAAEKLGDLFAKLGERIEVGAAKAGEYLENGIAKAGEVIRADGTKNNIGGKQF